MYIQGSSTNWKDFLLGLKTRGLRGIIFVGIDDHPGLKRAIMEVLPEAYWQRCYVHFLRNALDICPLEAATIALLSGDGFYDRRDAAEARREHVQRSLEMIGREPVAVLRFVAWPHPFGELTTPNIPFVVHR